MATSVRAQPLVAWTLALVAGAGVGCSWRRPGFPHQSYDTKQQIRDLEKTFDLSQMIRDYYDDKVTPPERKRDARDKLVSARLALIDLNYDDFVSQFSFEKQTLDSVSDITELGLNLATTAVGGASAKTVLGAVSAGVTGSKIAVDKNFFYEKTTPVLVTTMNAARKTVLIAIVTGMKQTVADYPLTQGLSDLDAYYFAGTFVGALQSIQADGGAKEVKADETLNDIRNTTYLSDASGRALQKYWMPGLPEDKTTDKAHQAQIRKWMDAHGLKDLPIQTLVTGDKRFANLRQQAVEELHIPVTP